MNTCLPAKLLDFCSFRIPTIWIYPKVQSILQKKVTGSKMPKGTTCFTIDSGSALSSEKLLFSGKGQGYRMKRKEDATNHYVRHLKVQNKKV